jgi:transcriptional regulator with GAF, ATPase, and Fis domain
MKGVEMVRIKLKKVISRKPGVASLFNKIISLTNPQISVWDVNEDLLLGGEGSEDGNLGQSTGKLPIRHGDKIIGWVTDGEQAEHVMALISLLVEKEIEKKSLSLEVLDLYREINLLYNLSEKLSASLEVTTVASSAIEEASRLISATGGSVILFDGDAGEREVVAAFGKMFKSPSDITTVEGFIRKLLSTTHAEIVNDVRADPRHVEGGKEIASLIYAPLKAKNQVMGVIFLVSEEQGTYTAGDLKLLNALASQAAPAIENALLYEKTLREAQEREIRLQRQVEELRIELNEVRQKEKVAEITESDYYQRLIKEAEYLRTLMGNG